MAQAHSWANLNYAVEKSDINEHYGNGMAAMGLRMFTEQPGLGWWRPVEETCVVSSSSHCVRPRHTY